MPITFRFFEWLHQTSRFDNGWHPHFRSSLYTPSTLVALSIISQFISIPRKAANNDLREAWQLEYNLKNRLPVEITERALRENIEGPPYETIVTNLIRLVTMVS